MNVEELKQKIITANIEYRFGNATLADAEFDALVEEYQHLVSADEFEKFRNSLNECTPGAKVKHPYVMGSLNKLKYEEKADLLAFYEKNIKVLNISAKVDGISCRLHYENGKLVSASTRGDGTWGEDLTDKIRYVCNVPSEISIDATDKRFSQIDIRGELVILKNDFTDLPGFANPRNAVAGIMNRKEWSIADVSKVTFVAYTILGPNFSKDEQFALLTEWKKFNVAWHMSFSDHHHFSAHNLDLAEELYKYAAQQFDYETDGLVLCSTSYKNEDKYRPDACVAFKINQQIAETTLVDVSWEGPSSAGQIVPVGVLEPVELGGVTISRVTLNNLNYIQTFNLKYGSKVTILRSGDVIPKIISATSTAECIGIEFPTTCPACGSELTIDGVNYYCKNPQCEQQMLLKVTQFIRKLGVKTASEKTLKKLGIVDFERLLAFRPSQKHKSELKLYDELLNKVFTASKEKLLAAMPFRDLAETNISKIIDFYSWDGLLTTDVSSLPPGIGEITLAKFQDSISENLARVNSIMHDCRYNSSAISISTSTQIKNGMSICITGACSIPRKQLEKLAADNGFAVKSGVTKDLTYLITNDPNSTSSKSKKAKQLGIRMLSEAEFMTLVNNSNSVFSI